MPHTLDLDPTLAGSLVRPMVRSILLQRLRPRMALRWNRRLPTKDPQLGHASALAFRLRCEHLGRWAWECAREQ